MCAMWTVVAVVLVGCLSPCICEDWDVVIHPATQKVVETSHVVFTCVSSRPNVTFKWTVPKNGDAADSTENEITNVRDDIRIIQTANNMSALVIERALIKRHKRKYRCLAIEPEAGAIQPSKDAFLKITQLSRLHKHFPHVMLIRAADDVVLPTREPNTMDMKCRTAQEDQTRDGVTWTWIKDGYIDLGLNDSGKYELHPDGRLHISKLVGADSGTYTCVASNNRGTAYGAPVRMNVSNPHEGKCLLQNGKILEVEETFQLNGDPCNTCTCEEGNRVTCRMIHCVPPDCNGLPYVASNETCCEFKCHGVEQGMCVDRDGNQVNHGAFYMPEEDPCLSCICNNGHRGRCRMVACNPPTCSDYVKSRDVCCDYTCIDSPEQIITKPEPPTYTGLKSCLDRKGNLARHGEQYHPNQDPCVTCTCNNGSQHMCISNSCRPRCTNYTIIPDTCCNYTCNENQAVCSDNKGNTHPHGSVFSPGDDPCESCRCENGKKVACATVACYPPPCKDFIMIPGKCCEFVCNESLFSTPKPLPVSEPSSCFDRKGKLIRHGEMYNPDYDACVTCTCNNGSRHRCASVSCLPPCIDYTIVPDTCCEFTCIEKEPCVDSDGTKHQDGDIFTLADDPCKQCRCENGKQEGCTDVLCPAITCPEFDLIPGTCCGFVCKEIPQHIKIEKVEGKAFIRPLGSFEVLVQWQFPGEASHNATSAAVWYTTDSQHSSVNVSKGRNWVILSDLDPNKMHKVEVKVATGNEVLKTPPVAFMPAYKARSNLVLNDAMGEVYESRGSLDYGSYSLPRMFNRVLLDETATVTINVAAFQRVDTTYLEQSPCRQDGCGVIRFYMYSMEGQPINVMSLMFNDNKDFDWAKLHL